jgi:hypothetical protein
MKINVFTAVLTACGAALLLTQTGCPLATESAGTGSATPPAAQVLAQAAAEKMPVEKTAAEPTAEPAKEEPKKETPKPSSDSNPSSRPKADRTPRKPGEAIKITFDNIILGMQADIPYRPWMLNDDVKDLEGKRVSITGVMLDKGTFKKGDNFILLRNKECKYGKGGQADHLADVKLKKGHVFGLTGKSVRVEGVLRVDPHTGDDGNTWSIYVLEDAVAAVQ